LLHYQTPEENHFQKCLLFSSDSNEGVNCGRLEGEERKAIDPSPFPAFLLSEALQCTLTGQFIDHWPSLVVELQPHEVPNPGIRTSLLHKIKKLGHCTTLLSYQISKATWLFSMSLGFNSRNQMLRT